LKSEPLYLPFEASSEKQKEAARAWIDDNISEVVYGGAKGGGKSYLGAAIIFANALTYPGTRYFIARKQLIDLRIHTIPTIDKVFKGWGIKLEDYGKFNGQDHCYYFKNGSAVLLIDAKEEPSDPLFERFGSMEMTQGWIEEAGEFEKNAKINLTISLGRCLNDKYGLKRKLLMTCNPKKNFLYEDYYLPWRDGKLKPSVKFIQAFAHENKKNESGYFTNLDENLVGIERERLLDGNWEYAEDADQLMSFEKIMDIFNNTHVPSGRKTITSDLARLGGDKIVIVEWDGNRGFVRSYEKQTLDITGAKLEETRYRMGIGVSDVTVDEDGLGGGVVDFMKFKGFVNNSSPLAAPDGPRDAKGNPIKENYDNLKSQCYYRFAKKVNDNNLYLQCESEDIKKKLIQELQWVRQKNVDDDKKKGVMPKEKVKEKIGRSPDYADAVMMHEIYDLVPKIGFRAAIY